MKKLFYLLVIIAATIGCGNKNREARVPSPEFTTYITAYTGGVISSSGTVRIEFVHPQTDVEVGAVVKDKLFSFSPSLKGEAYWISPSVIEFVPKEGSLKSGTLYDVDFKLGKLQKVDKGLEVFQFSFRTKEQDFDLLLDPGVITSGNPAVMVQRGTVVFGDVVDASKVAKMLSLDNAPAIVEPATGKAASFRFTFDNLTRPSDDDKSMDLKATGKTVDIDRTDEFSVVIPATGQFRFIDANLLNTPDNGIYLAFSEPLDSQQDLRGMIEIDGVEEYVFQVEDNIVKVFFQSARSEEGIEVDVAPGIRSDAGDKTSTSSNFSLFTEAPKPQVEIISSGNIMPNSEELLLVFRAVNLRAVDLRVIRIFESNVLMFLQDNTLDTDDELRRSGRMVYSKPLHLQTGRRTESWQDYSLDLAPLIKQEPGAIYRIELIPRLEYSTYGCTDAQTGETVQETEGMITLSAEDFDPDAESEWDTPDPYYYSWGSDDYDDYNWREREDPCKRTYYMDGERRASCNVMASNLGVIVKSGEGRKYWFAVADILSTSPVADADIKIYNFQLQQIGSGKSDSHGMAEVDVRGVGFAAVVEKDGWKTYIKLTNNEQNSLSRFDVGGKQIQKGLKGYIYGERGVWRPGDTLYLTLVLEDRLGKIPEGHPVNMELFNARGQFHTRQVNAHGSGGFYSFVVPTADSDPTGVWNVYMKVGGASFHKSLRVEAIKPNRLKIKLTVPGDKIDGSGRSTPASLAVSWLTGATARNLKATVEMSLVKGSSTPFKGFERFTFFDPASSFSSEQIDVWSGHTDGEGNASVSISSPSTDDVPGMMRADVVCRVFEPGGNASIYVESLPYSPYSRYVGVDLHQSRGEYFETDKENVFDIVTVNASGTAIDSHVDYKIYKLNWSWWWERGDGSLSSYVNGNYSSPIDEGTVNTAMGRGKVTFKVEYPEWGRYLVYVKDRTSGHASGGIIYVDWPSWRGRSSKTDSDGAAMLTFSTDKTSYEVGQTATIMIPEAPGGRALVSFENGSSVLQSQWVEMASNGDTKFSFKITEAMAPNFYVHISLLQPHEQTANSQPIRLYGVQPVEVNNKASKLEPLITAPDVLRPQTEFTVKVSEKNGRNMTYTLAVVDEGLLDLTNFKTPDAWKEFYAREALGVRTWDMYDYVIGAFGDRMGSLLSIGGDEDNKPGNNKANRFRPVVRFLGPFTLKGSSNSHKITLPMYIGSVRVMVVAGDGGAYGSAEKAIPVRTPLMLLATLPRVVSTGEDILLPANVFAMENDVKNVTVKAEVSGGVTIEKDKQLSLKFAKPGDEMAYFRLKAGSVPGVASIKVTATCGQYTSCESIEIAVRNPNPVIINITDTIVSAGNTINLPYSLGSNQAGEDNWVKLEVANLPSMDLSRRYDYLSNYENLCSEQLTSRGFPMLYLSQFRDVDKKETDKITNGVNSIIKLLYGRQISSGSFIYWPGYSEANEWITSYAGNFLWEAQQHGYEVNAGVLSRWKEFQRRAALSWTMPRDRDRQYYYYYQPDMVQAYRLYTLALAGSPEIGAMNRMKESPGISVSAKWRLAGAYALAGKQSAAAEVIADIRSTREIYDYSWGHGYTYGSAERDAAMVLESLVLMGDMAEATRQARVLSTMLTRETYLSTQSTAFALVAMASFASKSKTGEIDYSWKIDGKDGKDVSTSKSMSVTTLPLTKPAGEVNITSHSKGSQFVTLVQRTRPLIDTEPAMANGITVSVAYVDMNSRPIRLDSLGQGVEFKAVVTVVNTSGTTSFTDLALTHIVPSGWEIFNERMAISDQAMEENEQAVRPYYSTTRTNFSYQDIRDDRVLTYFDLRRGESKSFTVRLQAAYVGRFILPAILCEAMYEPTVRSRTTAGWTTVK